jgi:uncharacterized protein (TIGR02001 family)
MLERGGLLPNSGASIVRKTLLSIALLSAFPATVIAQQAAPAAAQSPHTFTGNVALVSDYRFRGISQTWGKPAIQGGFDYAHTSGFYLGTWASNISGDQYYSGNMEWDFYGGYKWGFAPDWTLDLGALYYWYPGDVAATTPLGACVYGTATACPKADTFELYAGLTWKWFTVKYSHSVDNKTFGLPSSRDTYYLDLSLNLPLGDLSKDLTGWTFMAHWGTQKYDGQIPGATLGGVPVSNDTLASYDDWKIGISYALPKDFTIGAFYTDTSGANRFYYGNTAEGGPFPRNVSKGQGVVYIQKTF